MITRENRNAGKIEDAVASVGAAITVLDHLWNTLAAHLPDEFPGPDATDELRVAHDALTAAIGV